MVVPRPPGSRRRVPDGRDRCDARSYDDDDAEPCTDVENAVITPLPYPWAMMNGERCPW
jgi:hypothetical protein